MFYFATLMTLADGLNRVGVVSWAAKGVSQPAGRRSRPVALIGFVAFFFVVHYAFASLTAHTVVVFPALLAAGASYPGMPVRVFALAAGLFDRADGRAHAVRDRPGPGLLRQRVHPPQGLLDPRVSSSG